MSDALQASSKPKFDPTITLGAVIQIGVLVLAFVTYLTSGAGRVEATADAVKRLESQVTQQAASTRDSLRESVGRVETVVASLQAQVGQMPTILERLRQQDEELKGLRERDAQIQRYLDERRGVLDTRFQGLEQRAIESIADRRELRGMLDSLHRGSGVSLPGAPALRR